MQENWAKEFPLQDGLIHLNHAGVGPWPRCTALAVEKFAKQNSTLGSKQFRQWEKIEAEVKQLCCQLINADSADDIAFIKNTSEALSIVAYGIKWQKNDNVIFAQQEFPSNRIIWQSLTPRFGVQARCVDLYQANTPEDALFAQVDNNTRLIAVSAVQYTTGLRMDLAKISEFCQAKGILLCVDAIQQLGAIPFDLNETPADFVMADAHKWLLSPEGIGLFYCNPRIREELQLHQFGWHMMANLGDYESQEWSIAHTARRFECGSMNNLGIQALHASLTLLHKIGIHSVYENISRNIDYLYDKYQKYNIHVLSDMDEKRRSGIITLQRPGIDNHLLYKHLFHAGVLCAYRSGGIRFSPHFYTHRDVMEQAVKLVMSFK